MHRDLADFPDFCRLERRPAPLTCSAYERDVGALIAFLEREGITGTGEVRPADLRCFLTVAVPTFVTYDTCLHCAVFLERRGS